MTEIITEKRDIDIEEPRHYLSWLIPSLHKSVIREYIGEEYVDIHHRSLSAKSKFIV